MKTRIIAGAIAIAVVAGLLAYDHARDREAGAVVLIALAIGAGGVECVLILRGPAVLAWLTGGSLALGVVAPWFLRTLLESGAIAPEKIGQWYILLSEPRPYYLALAAAVALWGVRAGPSRPTISAIASVALACAYVGFLGSYALALRRQEYAGSAHAEDGPFLFVLAVTKAADIGAYFAGNFLGRRPLAPVLSPKKTWEGLAGGLLSAAAVGAAAGPALGWGWFAPAAFAILIAGVGQAGDLAESLLKRSAEVKDSSTALPGMGGVLDVLDSPLFAFPFAYYLFGALGR